MFQTKITTDGVGQFKARYSQAAFNAALRRTLNDLTNQAATAVKLKIRATYNIKARDLVKRGTSNRNGMDVRLARGGDTDAYIVGFGKALPLINFVVSPKTPEEDRGRKRRNGVRVRVMHAGGNKQLKRVFVARMASGHIGLFERVSGPRYPIKQLYGPSVGAMLGNQASKDEVQRVVSSKAQEIFDRNIRFYSEKLR